MNRRPRSSDAQKRVRRTKVVRVSIEEGFEPLIVEGRYSEVLLVVTLAGAVLAQVVVPARPHISAEAQEAEVVAQLGDALWQRSLALSFARAARDPCPFAHPHPTVSVVVSAREGGEDLRASLDSVLALATPAFELIVVDEAARKMDVVSICGSYGARLIRPEAARGLGARNTAIFETKGELVALTTDECVVDPRWLDGLASVFVDPLAMAVVGYVGPLELETEPQRVANVLAGGLEPRIQPTTIGFSLSPVHDAPLHAGANVIFRRRVFEELGLFAEAGTPRRSTASAADTYVLYRILASGYRIRRDPARIVWQRYPRDRSAGRTSSSESAATLAAYASRCLVADREVDAISFWLRESLRRVVRLRRAERVAATLPFLDPARTLRGAREALHANWTPGRAPVMTGSPRRSTPRVARGAAPSLSVVIASRNRRDQLARTLTALSNQTYFADRYEVVVVLDGSTDGSADVVRSLSVPYRLHVVEQDGRGLAAARNRGAAEARHSLLLFLDDDTVPEPDLLSVHANAQRDAAAQHIAFGYCPPMIERQRLWELALRESWEAYYRRAAEPDHQWTYMDFPGANASLRRSLFLSSDGFDEEFAGRNEERDLGLRLLKRGARLAFYPDARASHDLDTRFTSALAYAREVGKSDVLLVRKHPELEGRLGGVAALRRPSPTGVSSRALFAYHFPEVGERVTRLALPLLDAFEALRLRRQWSEVTGLLLAYSYVAGLRDALPTRAEFLQFVARNGASNDRVVLSLSLDDVGPLRIPPEAVSAHIQLHYGGKPLAHVAAIEPGEDWDWEALTGRIVAQALDSVKASVPLSELLRLATGDAPGRRGSQP